MNSRTSLQISRITVDFSWKKGRALRLQKTANMNLNWCYLKRKPNQQTQFYLLEVVVVAVGLEGRDYSEKEEVKKDFE